MLSSIYVRRPLLTGKTQKAIALRRLHLGASQLASLLPTNENIQIRQLTLAARFVINDAFV